MKKYELILWIAYLLVINWLLIIKYHKTADLLISVGFAISLAHLFLGKDTTQGGAE